MGKRGPKPLRKEVIWSPKLAYAIGLIATDGCLSPDGRHILFVSKDIEQLENMARCLDLKAKLGYSYSALARAKYPRIQWSDVRLYEFLLKIGITPRKSLTLGAVSVPDKYFFDFLRGSFDGDGCFYSYFDRRWRSSFMFYLNFTSASPTHIQWLQETLWRLVGVKGHISRVEESKDRKRIETLRFAKREALVVIRKMYARPHSLYLSRKRLKIDKALRIVGESLARMS
jgi:hypothetical protein